MRRGGAVAADAGIKWTTLGVWCSSDKPSNQYIVQKLVCAIWHSIRATQGC